MSDIIILHISDLHFGIENSKNTEDKYVGTRQKEILNSLITTLCDENIISNEWKPKVIAISGDIAWSGQKDEYKLYKSYFVEQIESRLGIPKDHIITCPGNHDIIRDNADEFARPVIDKLELDVKDITLNNIAKRKEHFKGYIDEICDSKLENICKVFNFNEWPWVYFITLNSAWDCRDNLDEGRLRVSLSILEDLLSKIPNDEKNCIITLFHHPHIPVNDYVIKKDCSGKFTLECKTRNWLHLFERIPLVKGGRTFASYVDQKSNYILNGHIHSETPPQYRDSAIQLICGTVYSNDTPEFHCRLLKIYETGESTYRDIRRTLGDTDEIWEVSSEKKFHLEPVKIKRRVLENKQKEEKELLHQLEQAIRNYNINKNGDELVAAVDNIKKIISKNLEEQFHSNSIDLNKETMNNQLINNLENDSKLTQNWRKK